jgi:pimeloyl-ACP methyl ester carboxylesterase
MNLLLCAILLHGLGRGPGSLGKMQAALESRGYVVWNEGYPSTSARVEELSRVIDKGMKFCGERGATRIDFVTHSMGGILVRHYFQLRPTDKVGAVVMLAPPNHGSEVVDAYHGAWWFRWALGPAAQELGTGPDSLPNRMGPVPLNIGIIAGTRTSDPWFASLFSGPNDGKVSVESAKLAEMRDFLTVPAGHTFLMKSDEAIRQTLYFLENGRFNRAQP